MEVLTKNPSETEEAGKKLALHLIENNKIPSFIALFGEMGVGKTAFTRGFCDALEIKGVRSPTYTIVNEYRGRARIFHFDMYRISDGDDLYSTGYDEYVESDGYTIAEWSENVEDFIPEWAIFVTVSRVDGNPDERRIDVEYENTCI